MKQQYTSTNFIRKNTRSLPIGNCYINKTWEVNKLANVIVSRKLKNGNLIVGFYLVDLFCLGLRSSYFQSDMEEESLKNWLKKVSYLESKFIQIDYVLAHNIIYGSYEYGLENGIPQHKDFDKVTKYILEEDDERIPLIELEFGRDGKPFYFQTESQSDAFAENIIRLLKKNVGEGNFYYTLLKDIEEESEEEDEEVDDEEDPNNFNLPILKYLLNDGTVDIDKAKHTFNTLLDDGEMFAQYTLFISASMAIIHHYADEQRTNQLFEKWELDTTIDPEYEIEAGMSEQQIDRTYEILTEGKPSLKDIRYIRKNISSEVLADYILMKASLPKIDHENEDDSDLDYSEYNKREEQFLKDHPDYPLSKALIASETSSPDDLTIESIFGSADNISIFEFNEYLMMKLETLKNKPDASAFLAFRAILGQYLESDTVHEEIFFTYELLTIQYIGDYLMDN